MIKDKHAGKAVLDAWNLRRQKDVITCLIRIQQNAFHDLLACSGALSYFFAPIGDQREQFEVVWQQPTLKADIELARQQLNMVSDHAGLVANSGGLGFRVAHGQTDAARHVLGLVPKSHRIVIEGVPIQMSQEDVVGFLNTLDLQPIDDAPARRHVRGKYAYWTFRMHDELSEHMDASVYHLRQDEHEFLSEDCVITIKTAPTTSHGRVGQGKELKWIPRAATRSRSLPPWTNRVPEDPPRRDLPEEEINNAESADNDAMDEDVSNEANEEPLTNTSQPATTWELGIATPRVPGEEAPMKRQRRDELLPGHPLAPTPKRTATPRRTMSSHEPTSLHNAVMDMQQQQQQRMNLLEQQLEQVTAMLTRLTTSPLLAGSVATDDQEQL